MYFFRPLTLLTFCSTTASSRKTYKLKGGELVEENLYATNPQNEQDKDESIHIHSAFSDRPSAGTKSTKVKIDLSTDSNHEKQDYDYKCDLIIVADIMLNFC